MLPPCFVPNSETGVTLARIHQGLTVANESARPVVQAGLATITTGPTSRSGFELTEDGEIALGRYVYDALAKAGIDPSAI